MQISRHQSNADLNDIETFPRDHYKNHKVLFSLLLVIQVSRRIKGRHSSPKVVLFFAPSMSQVLTFNEANFKGIAIFEFMMRLAKFVKGSCIKRVKYRSLTTTDIIGLSSFAE